MGPVRRAFASAMRSTSAADRMKRRGARSTTMPTWAPSLRAQRGQFWNGDEAAALDTVNLHDGHDRYDTDSSSLFLACAVSARKTSGGLRSATCKRCLVCVVCLPRTRRDQQQ